jgi:threonine dehydrogenase-like Zn-dependent dehydrogenase
MAASDIPRTTMAPRFVGEGRITFEERPVPEPGEGQLLVQVKANAVCGSERGQFLRGAPVTPGHEAAGVVVAAGPATTTAVGTPGVIFLMDYCGICRSCRVGATNQCLDKRGDIGFTRDGGYGAYTLVPERIFFPTDADLPFAEATLLLDMMGTTGHALQRGLHMRPDVESVVITGAGPVGLGTLAMARLLLGPTVPVLIGDVVPYRLALAERLGGRPIDLAAQSLADGARAHGLEAVDLALDTSGKAVARQAGLNLLGKRGVLVCIGHGEGLNLTVSPDLIAPERAVLGSEYFCFHELPASLALLRQHLPYLRQIITHRYPVSDIQRAFTLFFEGATGKVIVEQ